MDLHQRIAGILHLATGLFGLAVVAIVYLFFGAAWLLAAVPDGDFWPIAVVGGFFAVLLGMFALLLLLEVVVAALWLSGRAGAKPWLIVVSVFSLPGFPWGTLMGAYTLWALLRHRPAMPTPAPTPVIPS